MNLNADALAARLRPLFEENFSSRGELGAAISVWQNGRSLVEINGGFRDARRERPWTNDTLVLIWSATKGLGSACLLHALQEHQVGLERRVSEFWPEFAQAGKEKITLADLMSHQAGLPALDQPVEMTDYPAVIRALEKQKPLWPPGTAHGYHARTFGFLIDEIMRRIESRSIGEYWRENFAEPLGLDIWIGLPAEENARVATTYAAKISATVREPFYRLLNTPGSLQRRTFNSPRGLNAVSAMNLPENRALSLVSLGGIGTATSLAKFYSLLANGGELDGRRFFSEKTVARMTTTLADGIDQVFGFRTAFSAGFMKDDPHSEHRIFGPSPLAFGHPGAGGSHAFADPENKLALAYLMNQMDLTVLPNEKAMRLVNAVYR